MVVLTAQKKPVQVEAILYTGDNPDDIFKFCPKAKWGLGNIALYIKALGGDVRIDKNDYVVKGVEGEFYPCKFSIFKKTYDIVDVKIS